MWIESHQSLRDHPKLHSLAASLGCSLPQAVGHLHYLWWWCYDYAPDGDLTAYDPQTISRACAYPGSHTVIFEALLMSGFIERHGDHLLVHDWPDYTRHARKLKRDAARKRREYRSFLRGDSAESPRRIRGVSAENCADQTRPDRTRPDKTREGEHERENFPVAATAAPGNAPPRKRARAKAPLGGQYALAPDGGSVVLGHDLRAQWEVTYPGLDLDRELRKMLAWCAANHARPSQRRAVNWLNRADPVWTRASPPARTLEDVDRETQALYAETMDEVHGERAAP